MSMDFIGLSVGMGYTDETVIGGGALKGKNCVISNIEEVADGVNVTFQWTLDNGTVQTETVLLPKGTQGEAGADGKSAYQYAKDGGYIGTETEFTTNIARSGVISKELEVERARIDNLTTLQDGSTTGDAELLDIRVGYNGKVYESAGESVRGQIEDTINDIELLANLQIPSEYVENFVAEKVKDYVEENSGGFATDEELDELKGTLYNLIDGKNQYIDSKKFVAAKYWDAPDGSNIDTYSTQIDGYYQYPIPIAIKSGSYSFNGINKLYSFFKSSDGTITKPFSVSTGTITFDTDGELYITYGIGTNLQECMICDGSNLPEHYVYPLFEVDFRNPRRKVYHIDNVDDLITVLSYDNVNIEKEIILSEGEYDLIAGYGDNWFETYGATYKPSLCLGGNTKLVGTGKTTIIADYQGNNANVGNFFSPIEIYGSCEIENISIIAKNVRYCIHEDFKQYTEKGNNIKYKGLYFYFDRGTSTFSNEDVCIGGGMGGNDCILIENCIFDHASSRGYDSLIFYHNSTNEVSKNNIVIKDCYINGRIKLTTLGASVLKTNALISNNKLWEVTKQVSGEDNIDIFEYNNTFTKV